MHTVKKIRTTTMRYGIGMLAFVVPMAIIGILHYYSINFSQTVLIVAALIVAAWFGGTGPGLIVAVLFELVAIKWSTQWTKQIRQTRGKSLIDVIACRA